LVLYRSDTTNAHQLEVLTALEYNDDDDWIDENNEPGCATIGERHVQGLVNLADNCEEDGGFWLVPGFHKYLPRWTREHREWVKKYGWYSQFNMFHEQDVPEMFAAACHISMRAGSAILWDQRTMHGSCTNRSFRPRFAQFFKMFPADHPGMTLERAKYRRQAILNKLQHINIDTEIELTSLGKRLFGLVEI
jgi:hypothetical protein